MRLRSAATAGDAAAAYEVGLRFAEGRGVPADTGEAARWFERAAAKGLAPAQFRYGSLLEKGQGVKKDIAQARRLYLAAAAEGNAKAMHNLAVLYAEGVDGKPDYNVAAQWFRKAAMRGIPDSQFNLGVLYARGLGVPANMAEVLQVVRAGRDQGRQGSREKARRDREPARCPGARRRAVGGQRLRRRDAARQRHQRSGAARRLGQCQHSAGTCEAAHRRTPGIGKKLSGAVFLR